mgnify:FL=1
MKYNFTTAIEIDTLNLIRKHAVKESRSVGCVIRLACEEFCQKMEEKNDKPTDSERSSGEVPARTS